MSFYQQVFLELLLAAGAALAVGNAYALFRRRRDRRQARALARTAPRAPRQRAPKEQEPSRELAQAPIGRSLLYIAIGLVAFTWALATLIA